jgi:hypothetical protein
MMKVRGRIEQLTGSKQDTGELRRDELLSRAGRAVQDQNGIGNPCRSHHVAMKVFHNIVTFSPCGRGLGSGGDGIEAKGNATTN